MSDCILESVGNPLCRWTLNELDASRTLTEVAAVCRPVTSGNAD